MLAADIAYRGLGAVDARPVAIDFPAPSGLAETLPIAPPRFQTETYELTTAAAARNVRAVQWVEPAENLWLLSLKNFGLALATFGVYHFWGRAEARRQVVAAIRVNGRPLEFSGTGREAFVSFIVGGVVAVAMVAAFLTIFYNATQGGGDAIEGIREFRWQRLTISLPLLFLLGSVVYRKRKHVLRRTWLAGERFDLAGQPWAYAWQHFWSAFLVPLSLGWAAPWRSSRLEARKIAEMHYAGRHFQPKGDLVPLYKAFALLWFGGGIVYLGTLIVLARFIGPEILAAVSGLSLKPLADWTIALTGLKVIACGLLPLCLFGLLYKKAWLEHLVSGVGFEGARLSLKLPKLAFLGLFASNTALKLGTLGIFAPVADARYMRFLVKHLAVDGPIAVSCSGR